MQFKIYCLMTSGLYLTDTVADLLMWTAIGMYKGNVSRSPIKTKECEGVITTDFRTVSFNGVSGMVFEAVVENDRGTKRVRYVVRTGDLGGIEDGEWVRIPIREERASSQEHSMN